MENTDRPVIGYPVPNPNTNCYPAHPPPPAAAAHPNYVYQSNPYNNNNNNQPDPRRAALIRRFLTFAVAPLLIFSAIILIAWLVLRPQFPQFRVDSFSLSNFTLTNDSSISFAADVRLTAQNPNKKLDLLYERVDAVLYYRPWPLARTAMPPFSLDTESQAPLSVSFAAVGNFVEHVAVDGINKERGRNGNVGFNLRISSRVSYVERAWRTRNYYVTVFCDDLFVGIPSNGRPGSLTGGPRQCRVEI